MEELYRIKIQEIYRTIKSEGWPFILICTYLFFEYVRPQSIYPWLDFVPWTQIILIFTIISMALTQTKFKIDVKESKLMLTYSIIVLLSATFSQYANESFSRLRTFFDWLIIYFLIVSIVNNRKRFFIFLLSFLLYSFKMAQHGALSWIKRGFKYTNWGVVGAPGWFNNSGEVGVQMCIFVPLSIAFILGIRKWYPKRWLFLFCLMPLTGMATVAASSSRGAVLGLVGGLLWLALSMFKQNRVYFFRSVTLLLLVLTLLYVLTPTQFKRRFQRAGKDKTSTVRLIRWQEGLNALERSPMLGVGFDVWDIYCAEHTEFPMRATYLIHNIFLQCATELGVTGLGGFLALIISLFFTTKKARALAGASGDEFIFFISYGFDGAMVGYLISGFFVTVLYYPFFWIQCAMTVSMYLAAKSLTVKDSQVTKD